MKNVYGMFNSPELLRYKKVNPKFHIWELGWLVYEIVTYDWQHYRLFVEDFTNWIPPKLCKNVGKSFYKLFKKFEIFLFCSISNSVFWLSWVFFLFKNDIFITTWSTFNWLHSKLYGKESCGYLRKLKRNLYLRTLKKNIFATLSVSNRKKLQKRSMMMTTCAYLRRDSIRLSIIWMTSHISVRTKPRFNTKLTSQI